MLQFESAFIFASRTLKAFQIRRQKAQTSYFPSQIFLGTVMVPKFVDKAIEYSSQIGFPYFITASLCILAFFGYHHGTQNFHISKVYILGFLQPCRPLFYPSQIQTYDYLNFNSFHTQKLITLLLISLEFQQFSHPKSLALPY